MTIRVIFVYFPSSALSLDGVLRLIHIRFPTHYTRIRLLSRKVIGLVGSNSCSPLSGLSRVVGSWVETFGKVISYRLVPNCFGRLPHRIMVLAVADVCVCPGHVWWDHPLAGAAVLSSLLQPTTPSSPSTDWMCVFISPFQE